jgi:hypothetical protein
MAFSLTRKFVSCRKVDFGETLNRRAAVSILVRTPGYHCAGCRLQ